MLEKSEYFRKMYQHSLQYTHPHRNNKLIITNLCYIHARITAKRDGRTLKMSQVAQNFADLYVFVTYIYSFPQHFYVILSQVFM
jgi:hypothetical protein